MRGPDSSPQIESVIKNSSFYNNYGAGSSGVYEGGGAVTAYSYIQLNIDDCHFENNSTTLYGGAVYLGFNRAWLHTVKNNIFINNSAGLSGGAIVSIGWPSVRILLNNNVFIGNTAENTGAAIFHHDHAWQNYNMPLVGSDNIFYENECRNNEEGFLIWSRLLELNNSYFFDSYNGDKARINYLNSSENNCIISNNVFLRYFSGSTGTTNIRNNYWGTKVDNEVNNKVSDFYDDPNFNSSIANYSPFLFAPIDELIGTPSDVTDIKLKQDNSYQNDLVLNSVEPTDTLFIEFSGIDTEPNSKGVTVCLVVNTTTNDTVVTTLIETSESSGIYRGQVYVSSATDNPNNIIGVSKRDNIQISSRTYPKQTTTVGVQILSTLDNGNGPNIFNLQQNYPNPFNPSTTIHYTISEENNAAIAIYDLVGRKINDLISSKQSIGEPFNPMERNRPQGECGTCRNLLLST